MNAIDLAGRVAVITGGAIGLGYATAQRMKASGATVVLWDRDEAALAAAEKEGFGTAVVDVSDPASVDRAAAATGKVDILVNSAGIAGTNATVWEMSIEDWRRVVDIDLTGTFLCCRAVLPRMIEAGYGRIVNIASIAGKEGNPLSAHYSAAKAGVIGLTKSLGKECVGTGVIANCIAPAVIETAILKQNTPEQNEHLIAKIPMGRMGQPAEVAALIAWLSSEDCSFSTGAVYDISGGRATY
jgi:2-dehydro-3-deoxy-L-rhamnonate dehydrogenase (NAD+)